MSCLKLNYGIHEWLLQVNARRHTSHLLLGIWWVCFVTHHTYCAKQNLRHETRIDCQCEACANWGVWLWGHFIMIADEHVNVEPKEVSGAGWSALGGIWTHQINIAHRTAKDHHLYASWRDRRAQAELPNMLVSLKRQRGNIIVQASILYSPNSCWRVRWNRDWLFFTGRFHIPKLRKWTLFTSNRTVESMTVTISKEKFVGMHVFDKLIG